MLRLLLRKRPWASWGGALLFVAFLYLSSLSYFEWVKPSIEGQSDQHIAADSMTYMQIAESLREGQYDPLVIAALARFPNGLVAPVALAYILPSPTAIVVLNYGIFFISVFLICRSMPIQFRTLTWLLILNPTTIISLLSLNKEIFDLLCVAITLYALSKEKRLLLLLALLISLITRFELCLALATYAFAISRLNPLRTRRAATLVALLLVLSITLPNAASQMMQAHFEEAIGHGTIAPLDELQMHYLFFAVSIPKIFLNNFSELINLPKWAKYSVSDLANSYIVFFNNLAMLCICILLWLRRAMSLKNDCIYFAAIIAIVMSVSFVVQPRYFYASYALLCVEASRVRESVYAFQAKEVSA